MRPRRFRILIESLLILALGLMIWKTWFVPKESPPDSGSITSGSDVENERMTRFARSQSADDAPAPQPVHLDKPPRPFIPETTVAAPVPEEKPSLPAQFLGTVVDTSGQGVPGEVMIFSPDGRFSIAAQNGVFADTVTAGTWQVIAQYREGPILRMTEPLRLTFVGGEALRHDFVLPLAPPSGTLGLEVALQGEYAEVTAVAPGSPAATAGVRVGDAISEINGAAIRQLDAEAIKAALFGAPGERVRISLVVATPAGFEEIALELTREAQ